MQSVSRNDPCPCGSGKKWKKCCYTKQSPPPQRGLSQIFHRARQDAPSLSHRTIQVLSPSSSSQHLTEEKPLSEPSLSTQDEK